MLPISLILLILIICFTNKTFELSPVHQSRNLLNGQHLRVIWTRWEGNRKGLGGPLKSGVILDYLSARYNFTYNMLQVSGDILETSIKGNGLFTYLQEQRCDLLLQDVVASSRRLNIIDLTTPWNYGYLAFLIPVPDNIANISAVVKPFQWPVWLSVLVSIPCVIFTLNQLQRFRGKFFSSEKGPKSEGNSPVDWREKGHKSHNGLIVSREMDSIYLYVFGNLLSQGSPFISKRLSLRIVAGVWTLGAFVIVQAYTSTLFTYVMIPNSSPLINSIFDVVEKPGINMFIRKGNDLDYAFSNTKDVELYKKLGEKLDSSPNSRCINASECVRLIRPTSKNVFLDSIYYQMDIIKQQFQKTGKCSLQLANEGFIGNFMTSFALQKNSPYTSTVSHGLLELREIGLIDHWDTWFRPMPPQCINNLKLGYKNKSPEDFHNKISPLSLKHLSGVFLILLIGFTLSVMIFFWELKQKFEIKKHMII